MSRDANIAAQEHLAESINKGDVDAAMQSFAQDAVDHDPAPTRARAARAFAPSSPR